MMKTKKIKIITALILSFVALIIAISSILALTKVSYAPKFNAPSRIIVYNTSQSNNIVFEPNDKEYLKIYSLIVDSYKQSTLNALASNSLKKDIKIKSNDITSINFSGIKVNFVYDTPQVVKYKSKSFIANNQNYWYQNLIFNIDNVDSFKYNMIAIIPPIGANNYIDGFTYSLHYDVYANYINAYNYVIKLF